MRWCAARNMYFSTDITLDHFTSPLHGFKYLPLDTWDSSYVFRYISLGLTNLSPEATPTPCSRHILVEMASFLGALRRNWLIFRPPVAPKQDDAIKFGILGAANIADMGFITPAKSHPEVIVYAVAARDKARAVAYAKSHGIPEVRDSYQGLKKLPFSLAHLIGLHTLTSPQRSWTTQPSTRSTSPRPTVCTSSGRSRPWPRASTSCSRSPAPPTPRRPSCSSTRRCS